MVSIAAALSLALVGASPLPSPDGGPKVGEPGPDFTLATKDGADEVRLSHLRGRPTVLVLGSYT